MTRADAGPKTCIASDGLVARIGRAYVSRKLDWLEEFLIHALKVTKSMPDRAYVDLFAGPGLTVTKDTKEEIQSGALRALRVQSPGKYPVRFTQASLVNVLPEHQGALRQRAARMINRVVPEASTAWPCADSNSEIESIMAGVKRQGYTFVFADPENARQLPFRTLERLTACGHAHLDLYMLYPWGMDLRRRLGRDHTAAMTAFYGSDAWQAVRATHPTGARNQRSMAMRDLYLQRLRTLWEFAMPVEEVNFVGDHNLYWMIYATNNKLGETLAAAVTKKMRRERSEQGEILLG